MSKIKILKASYLYPGYVNDIYDHTIGLKNESYERQYEAIMQDMFGWSDVWKRTLDETGQFEVMEVMVTNENIQRCWAKENNVDYSESSWMLDILEEQVRFFEPAILFVHDNIFLTAEVVNRLKKKYLCIQLVVGYDGIALNNLDRFSGFDIVLSCLESTTNFYTEKSMGKIEGYFLPLGFDTQVLEKIKGIQPSIDFSFIGSLVRGKGYHMQRIKDVTKLANNSPIKIFSSGMGEPYEPYRYLQRNRLKKMQFEEFWQVYSIGRKTYPAVYGVEMYQLLASSKLTFNCHLDNAGGKAANMRLFEATGAGTCLVTDYMDNLKDFFDPENEVVTYKSIPECIDKVKNLLRDEKLRCKIAKAGHEKTMSQHTFQSRILKFSEVIKTKLK